VQKSVFAPLHWTSAITDDEWIPVRTVTASTFIRRDGADSSSRNSVAVMSEVGMDIFRQWSKSPENSGGGISTAPLRSAMPPTRWVRAADSALLSPPPKLDPGLIRYNSD
jgi:hypothetical protein